MNKPIRTILCFFCEKEIIVNHNRQYYCSDCKKIIRSQWQNKWRSENKEQRRIYFNSYEKTLERKIKHDIRWNSRKKVIIYPGTLCKYCSNPAIERHHPDYNKPDEIELLCKLCHIKKDCGVK